ncbi:MAG: hypothetical protein Q4G27_09975 [Flavobacteriaceae bacterium]|nr:hypothetical protein [Flavobacteriaceae bacterium]
MKKYHFLLSFLVLLGFQSCDHTDAYFGGSSGPILNPDTYTRLADIVKFNNVPTDALTFDPSVDSDLTAAFGTSFHIPANAVAGENLPEELIIEIREYPTLQKMAMSNVQTMSNQDMLVTGGNFFWRIIDSEGTEYQLNTPSTVTATQAVVLNMGTYATQAKYYKGAEVTQNGKDVINWTLMAENQSGMGANNVFNYVGLETGWANVDALYNYTAGERTQFTATLETSATLQDSEQMVLLIVRDFPSVMNLTTRTGNSFSTYNNSIPMGLNGTLIGVALDSGNNLHIGSTVISVEGDDTFSIDLTEGSIAQLQHLINQASN